MNFARLITIRFLFVIIFCTTLASILHALDVIDLSGGWRALRKGSWRLPQATRPAGKGYVTFAQYVFQGNDTLDIWQEKIFKGHSEYGVVDIKSPSGQKALHAASQGTASALYREVDIPIAVNPILSWEWRAETFPQKALDSDLSLPKKGTDFVARVTAIFKGRTIWSSEVIQYVWDEHRPEGWSGTHPISNKIKVLVVEHGIPKSKDHWATERRDLVKDYEMLFGRKPNKNLGAIAIMSDSDNTKSKASAYYTWITIETIKHQEETPS